MLLNVGSETRQKTTPWNISIQHKEARNISARQPRFSISSSIRRKSSATPWIYFAFWSFSISSVYCSPRSK